jgi:hypothetical protein
MPRDRLGMMTFKVRTLVVDFYCVESVSFYSEPTTERPVSAQEGARQGR